MTTRIINNKSRAWYLTLWHLSILKTNGYIRKTTTDQYVDGLILRDGKPLMWQFDGGYVELDTNGTPTSWNYYITDHLGSTRKVVDSNNNVKETINYYPFGSEMRIQDPALIQQTDNNWHPFRFTSKELDNQNGLNMYDFGARLFDVAGVPMWTSVDPLAEKYYPFTPYNYCAGDPINFIDPKGMEKIEALDPKKNKDQIKAAESFSDEKDVINIWAHGSKSGMTVYDKENGTTSRITDAKSFVGFLNKSSNVWKNRETSQNVTIVLHSCETGQICGSEENFAQKLSKGLNNVTIIAPTDNVYNPKGEELGVYKSSVEQNKSADGKQIIFSSDYLGKWVQYEKGQQTQVYKGNTHPGEKGYNIVTSQSSMWDKFKHKISNMF